jgi:hypothetical protein
MSLHLQARRKAEQEINVEALISGCFHVDFFLDLFFDTEGGGDVFLRNVGWLSTDYMTLYPRR